LLIIIISVWTCQDYKYTSESSESTIPKCQSLEKRRFFFGDYLLILLEFNKQETHVKTYIFLLYLW